MTRVTASEPDDGADAVGEWFLIATFDPTDLVVIAKGDDPSVTPPNDGYQKVDRMRFHRDIRRNLIVKPVLQSVADKKRVEADLNYRGRDMKSIIEPIVSGTGHVHAAWVWVGSADELVLGHVPTGAWEWRLTGDAFVAIYGPGIPGIYGRPEWAVGAEYPVHETVDNAVVVQQSETAKFLEEQREGSRHRLRLAIRKPVKDNVDNLVAVQAATQIVRRDGHLMWLGVTWDVTQFDRPEQIAEYAAFSVLMKNVEGWVATVLWDEVWPAPIQIVRWFNHKFPDQFWVDPETKRFRVHPEERGLIRRWTNTLDRAGDAGRLEGVLRIWGVDGTWHEVAVDVARIRGVVPSAAVVRITDSHAV